MPIRLLIHVMQTLTVLGVRVVQYLPPATRRRLLNISRQESSIAIVIQPPYMKQSVLHIQIKPPVTLTTLAHGVKVVPYLLPVTPSKLHNIYHHLYSSVTTILTKSPRIAVTFQTQLPVMRRNGVPGVLAWMRRRRK